MPILVAGGTYQHTTYTQMSKSLNPKNGQARVLDSNNMGAAITIIYILTVIIRRSTKNANNKKTRMKLTQNISDRAAYHAHGTNIMTDEKSNNQDWKNGGRITDLKMLSHKNQKQR